DDRDTGRDRLERAACSARRLDHRRSHRCRHNDPRADHDEAPAPAPTRSFRLGSARRRERLVLPEDPGLELPQRLAPLEAQPPPQPPCAAAVCRKRLSLASRAVEGENEPLEQLLPEGVLGDERLELGYELAVVSQRELGVGPVLERGEPTLVEARDLGLRPRLEAQVGKRIPPPERERFLQGRRRLRRWSSRRHGHELLEAVGVDLAGSDKKLVAAASFHDPLRAERAPKPGDIDLDALHGGRRRFSVPDLLDQALGGDGAPAPEQEESEERSLLVAAQRDRVTVSLDLERSEDPKLHERREFPIL